jgi:VanZ family protein
MIFALSSSSRPPVEIDLGFDLADKLLHAVLFSGLGACLAYGLFRISAAPFARRAALVLPLGAALGALDEIHQLFVPLRSADPFDALADALGVGLGLILFRLAAEPRLRGRG